jgi:hypothetical protein
VNANGGDLLYGVDEQKGQGDRIVPISILANPVDATRRRLGQVLESELEARSLAVACSIQYLSATGYCIEAGESG